MNISQNGLNILKKFEGFISCPYKDQVGIPTIGIGTTFYEDGKKVTMTDPCITVERAFELVKHYMIGTENIIKNKVEKPLSQNQFDSLCSIAYNIGQEAFTKSTLLKLVIVNPSDPSIRSQFARWNKAAGKVLSDLVSRRKAEADLYFS